MNIIDFFKEFEFIKRRRLRSLGVRKLRGVRPDRGAPPETAPVQFKLIRTLRYSITKSHEQNFIKAFRYIHITMQIDLDIHLSCI